MPRFPVSGGFVSSTIARPEIDARSSRSRRKAAKASEGVSEARVRNPDLTQQNLLEAARTVFGEHGYARSTIDAIASQAGVSKGAFYNHFDSKEEIFITILELRGEANRSRFLDACRAWPDPAERALSVIETIVGFVKEDSSGSNLTIEFLAHATRNPEIGVRLARLDLEWRAVISALLRGNDAESSIDFDAVALCLVALLDGLILQARVDPGLFDADVIRDRIGPLVRAWFPPGAAS